MTTSFVSMRLHYFQHVPFESPANILQWAKQKHFVLSGTRLYEGASFPGVKDFDGLIIMGGPMNVYEEKQYPWLVAEKKFIEKAIAQGKPVLGICLGAQLIASVLGAKVFRNPQKEIGWFRVTRLPEALTSKTGRFFPETFWAFHWHGDTFDLPKGSLRLGESAACCNQAFEYEGRVLGLQFHLETSHKSLEDLILHCGHELVPDAFVQHRQLLLKGAGLYLSGMYSLLERLLEDLYRQGSR